MVARIQQGGHQVVAWNRTKTKREQLIATGATWAETFEDLLGALDKPRVVWMMVPEGAVDELIDQLEPLLDAGDLLVDGGNCRYSDTKARARRVAARGLRLLDAGVSGGIWGLQVGYCTMVGGEREDYERLGPVLDALAPPGGHLYCGPSGAGHFTKMVHNGIEYGMMQAYAEGFELLQASEYTLDLQAIAHLWNQGSVIRSWLLELGESALAKDPDLGDVQAFVEDSGEGRWTVEEAVRLGVPTTVLAASLFNRFKSRQCNSFSDRMLAVLRKEFGGHAVVEAKSE